MFDNFMSLALQEAQKVSSSDVPIGAVIVDIKTKQIVGRSYNQTSSASDPTAHAEIIAIRQASQLLGLDRLRGMALYTTLQPCLMCIHAISLARIQRLYIGARDERFSSEPRENNLYNYAGCNHKPECYFDIMRQECEKMLNDFFIQMRLQKEEI